MSETIVEIATKNTVENKAKDEAKSKGSAFVRTSKILFQPNSINKVKQTELSNFLDLCSDALNFYTVYFARYYQFIQNIKIIKFLIQNQI